jgi:hypothetical protein
MNQRLIVIDGKTYKSVDEMSEDVRRSYENAMRDLDKNQDGTPDAFEGLASLQGSTSNVMSSTKIIVNGQTYESLEQLPPEFRAKYEQAMGAMDANRNGIPDFIEVPVSSVTQNPQPAARKPNPVIANIEPESSGGWLLWLAGILVAGLCLIAAGAGIWYFFLR